jgi:glycosyltransferase involved in cell wall biosynthesis
VPAKIVYVAGSALRVHEQIGYAKSKSVFIPNGYQLPDLVRRRGEKRQKRQELGIPEDAVLIGSVGRFNAQKDHRSFVFAAAELAAREPRAHFLMMGIEIAWSNRELAGWITQSGYRERFHLLGERRDVIDWLLAIDIFCLHSVGEGFPNVLAEAMSAGVPCITTDVGDAAYLIGDTGAVVQPGDVLAIVRCLEALIAAGEAERERLGQAARDRIAANFSIDAISNRFKELYAEMMHLAADASADREPVAVH